MAVWHPFPCLQLAYGNASTSPQVAAAAEDAHARGARIEIRESDRRSFVEHLVPFLSGKPAALDDTNADRRSEESPRDGETGGARANDAQVCFDIGGNRFISVVDDQLKSSDQRLRDIRVTPQPV